MMDQTPPTLGDDWPEMPADWELEFVEDAETAAVTVMQDDGQFEEAAE